MPDFPSSLLTDFARHLANIYPVSEVKRAARKAELDLSGYRGRPVEYAEEVLQVATLSDDQKAILRSLYEGPCSVLVPSGHDTGKTFVAAVAVNYWYDTHRPCGIMTFGPKFASLKDTVWAEVRILRMRNPDLSDDFIGPSAPEMRDAPDHWAKAVTAAKDASLTGRHLWYMLFLIEEACQVDPIWWQVISTMFDPSLGHARLAIFNPTDTTSEAYLQDCRAQEDDGTPAWTRYPLSALNHPNVHAELAGKPKPIPGAVSVAMIDGWVREWCEPVEACDLSERLATDLQWPPERPCPGCGGVQDGGAPGFQGELPRRGVQGPRAGLSVDTGRGRDVDPHGHIRDGTAPDAQGGIRAGRPSCAACNGSGSIAGGPWYRPGPLFQCRALGLWPELAGGVWGDAVWRAAEQAVCREPDVNVLPEVGCDVAHYGDDFTEMHSRWGCISLAHEAHNGWDYPVTAGRLKQLARQWADFLNARRDPNAVKVTPEQIPLKIDVCGEGHKVLEYADGFNFIGVRASDDARRPDKYPNLRSQLWFDVVENAKRGRLSLARLPREWRFKLRRQALAPEWVVDSAGRQEVEKKEDTKKKLGRSPDGMDALNLAYHAADVVVPPRLPPTPRRDTRPHALPQEGRRQLFGRR